MDLSTSYLGLRLAHPFMAGASPLSASADGARRLEQAGSSAIVLPSLFEEGTKHGAAAVRSFYGNHDPSPDAPTIPAATALGLSPREYLAHVVRVKKAVQVPVIASLNGTGPGTWISYAASMEKEGADAIELNLYPFPAESWDPAQAAELRMLDLVRSVKGAVKIPVAVKLSPFYTSLPHFARELGEAGADAVLIFNRFYQADVDPERLMTVRTLEFSTSSELLLRLRWLGVLYGKVGTALGVTGGVHTPIDAVKAILSGAQVVQVVSAILHHGFGVLSELRRGAEEWFREHGYPSLEAARGKVSLLRAPDPGAFERRNYIYNLDSWFGPLPEGMREPAGAEAQKPR